MQGCRAAWLHVESAMRAAPVPTQLGLALVGAAAALGLAWLARKLAPGAAILYARIGKRDLLDHPARRGILRLVEAEPGIGTSALAARLALDRRGALAHHLRALEKAGLVKPLLAGRERAWFAASASRRAAAPEPERRRAIIALVARSPGVTQRDVAGELGIAPSTTSHHVKRLEASGALRVAREGRTARLFPGERDG